MVKHYLVIAHRGPEQVHRLVTRLDDGSSHVWVHLDAATPLDGWEGLSAHPVARIACKSFGNEFMDETVICFGHHRYDRETITEATFIREYIVETFRLDEIGKKLVWKRFK